MFSIEEPLIEKHKPLYYKRLQDDVFAIFKTIKHANAFYHDLQNAHPDIDITFEISPQHVIFLDLHIFKGKRYQQSSILDTKIYSKPTSRFLYLHWESNHPKHQKKSIVKSGIIRIIRSSSHFDYYIEDRNIFLARLRARSYPINILNKIAHNLNYNDRHNILQEKKKEIDNTQTPTVFVTTYNNNTNSINLPNLLRKNWHIIDTYHHDLFPTQPIVAWKRDRTLGALTHK